MKKKEKKKNEVYIKISIWIDKANRVNFILNEWMNRIWHHKRINIPGTHSHTNKQTNENQTETFTMSMCKSDANRKSLAMSS